MFSKKLLPAPLILAGVLALYAAPCTLYADGSRLIPGDVIAVRVDGEKEFTKDYEVDKDGFITVPMLDPVKIADLTSSEAAGVITKALGKVLINPQVTVTFIARTKMQVFVVGQVGKPGATDVGVGDRVIQAMANAGYDDTADLSRVSVHRGDEVIDVDLTKFLSGTDLTVNIPLQSGDTVVVPRQDIGLVMVLGQVPKTGSVPIKRNMTFRELMGLIGGVNVEADTANITIKRQGTFDVIHVDYKKAMDGDPSSDYMLQAGDTIYVPELETAFFTVMGGVGKPGQYPLKGKLTLSEAIGMAGGPVANMGDLRKVQLMRSATADGKPSETQVLDLTKVLNSANDEPLVKRGDVVYVPIHKDKMNPLQIIQSILPFGWLFKN
ncbi:MAG: SLBB domain-containing protein [Armatimonadota bacterium]|nr:SLBB domain-containing protein [bacterium]